MERECRIQDKQLVRMGGTMLFAIPWVYLGLNTTDLYWQQPKTERQKNKANRLVYSVIEKASQESAVRGTFCLPRLAVTLFPLSRRWFSCFFWGVDNFGSFGCALMSINSRWDDCVFRRVDLCDGME